MNFTACISISLSLSLSVSVLCGLTRKGLELLLEHFGWIWRIVYTHCAAHLRGVVATRIISGCATFLGLHFKVKISTRWNTPAIRGESPRLASNWFIYLMFLYVCFGFWLILWRFPCTQTAAPSRLVSCISSIFPTPSTTGAAGCSSDWCHVQMLYNKWSCLAPPLRDALLAVSQEVLQLQRGAQSVSS